LKVLEYRTQKEQEQKKKRVSLVRKKKSRVQRAHARSRSKNITQRAISPFAVPMPRSRSSSMAQHWILTLGDCQVDPRKAILADDDVMIVMVLLMQVLMK
jgi:hypothetical protein